MEDTPKFETPSGDESPEVASSDQFQKSAGHSHGEQTVYVPEANGLMEGFATPIIDALGEIAESLKRSSHFAGVRTWSLDGAGREDFTDVQGVAIGLGDPGDGPPGAPTLTVFVAEAQPRSDVREYLVDRLDIKTVRDLPLTVRRSGQFEAQPHTFRVGPAPGGVSVGHINVTAGTLGCLAVGRSAPRNKRLLILSNNHVLADSNAAAADDIIIQPGPSDGGTNQDNIVALLDRFVPIEFGGSTNFVDAATAWAWPERVRTDVIYPSDTGFSTFRIGRAPEHPSLGNEVGKSGRTTQLTRGRISHVNAAVNVSYGPAGVAHFEGQFLVEGQDGQMFSERGDSGSIIWKWQSELTPVGLLFAGGGRYSIASPMPWVIQVLDIDLYT